MPIDPVTEEIVATRLWEVVEHVEPVLFHGGYSPILRESFDGSATILNARGEVVVGSGFPIHLIPYWRIAQAVLRAYPPQVMERGDVFATNDPFLSGNFHVPDMAVLTPSLSMVGFWQHRAQTGCGRDGAGLIVGGGPRGLA